MADTLEDFADWLEIEAVEAVEPLRQVVTSVLRHTFQPLEAETPVLSGDLKADLSMYSAGGGISKEAEVVMAGWKPDEEVGIISTLPYGPPIFLGGHSQKFAPGRLDAILEDGLNVGLLEAATP